MTSTRNIRVSVSCNADEKERVPLKETTSTISPRWNFAKRIQRRYVFWSFRLYACTLKRRTGMLEILSESLQQLWSSAHVRTHATASARLHCTWQRSLRRMPRRKPRREVSSAPQTLIFQNPRIADNSRWLNYRPGVNGVMARREGRHRKGCHTLLPYTLQRMRAVYRDIINNSLDRIRAT